MIARILAMLLALGVLACPVSGELKSYAKQTWVEGAAPALSPVNLQRISDQVEENARFTGSMPDRTSGILLETKPGEEDDTVILHKADALVMSDGEIVTDWENLEATSGSIGAGGLDETTASVSVSSWYGIYAITQSVTSSKPQALLLHREANPTADVIEAGTGTDLKLYDAAAREYIAQGFQVSADCTLYYADVSIKDTGSPGAGFWYEIQGDSGGDPDGTAVARSETIRENRITTSYNEVCLKFISPPSLTASSQYHLVMKGTRAAADATNYVMWQAQAGNPYADGEAKYYTGAAWASAGGPDAYMILYTSDHSATLNYPGSYDQSCKVGYVYVDPAGNFKEFTQVEQRYFARDVFDDGFGLDTHGSVHQEDLSAIIPHTLSRVWFAAGARFATSPASYARIEVSGSVYQFLVAGQTIPYAGGAGLYPLITSASTYAQHASAPIFVDRGQVSHYCSTPLDFYEIYVTAFEWLE